ncbi:5-carboxymethyl-2-hydroxymuconate Delta-isomerase [Polaribacter sargassicola]|uniref:5-carboxymethyl-2-hydroxymuconate Delta-isomerase n=1 Tax=Polaribacter sargassicola TaxID=2836891 RepID=UPI001F2B3AA1|nr:5-carboxymethyl-2-hydroxymuconate Delta-isomerase [Polaribacter sp. DS7-9]MCG1034786.1 5-carboxymethyl-2-hydroxymuconate Delta-isomerase [Polaribacter sp. DS7-9]
MPHCIIEYSNDLETRNKISKTVKVVNQELINSELFDNTTIKTRALPIKEYLVGGKKTSFIHTTIKSLQGRTDSQKKILSNKILNVLSVEYTFVKNISVEIIDINPNTYSKKQ